MERLGSFLEALSRRWSRNSYFNNTHGPYSLKSVTLPHGCHKLLIIGGGGGIIIFLSQYIIFRLEETSPPISSNPSEGQLPHVGNEVVITKSRNFE